MVQVLLVRHAQSEWNAAGRWQGWADPPLTALGRAQAERAGALLRRTTIAIDRAVSSNLDRARTTAAIVVGIAGSPTLSRRDPLVEEVAGLRELDVGEWSGLTRQQIRTEWPETLAEWEAGTLDSAPGGERRSTFDDRVRGALLEVLAGETAERVLIVAHGGVVGSIGRWLGAPPAHALHVAGYWLHHDATRTTVTAPVDLLRDAPTDDRIPDDSAEAR